MSAVSVVAVLAGYPAIAEVVGGAMVVTVAVVLVRPLTLLVTIEAEPRKVLLWNVLLVLLVVLALVGVGVMAAAIPAQLGG